MHIFHHFKELMSQVRFPDGRTIRFYSILTNWKFILDFYSFVGTCFRAVQTAYHGEATNFTILQFLRLRSGTIICK